MDKGNTIIISGNLPIHSNKEGSAIYAPSCTSVAAFILYGAPEEKRKSMVFLGIANPEGMPKYTSMLQSEFRFISVETSKRPKDLIFSEHLSQACHHALGKSALFPEDLETPYNEYLQFNQEFLCTLKSVYSSEDTIIILGKHLLMLPGLIRKEYPQAKILYVFLCPFPSYELFSCIPYSKEVLESIMACDRLELQSESYQKNFISTAFLLAKAQNKELTAEALESIKGNLSVVFVKKQESSKGSREIKKEELISYAEGQTGIISHLSEGYKTEAVEAEVKSLKELQVLKDYMVEESSKEEEYLKDVLPVVERLSKPVGTDKMYIVYAENTRVLVSVSRKNAPKEFIERVKKQNGYLKVYKKIAEPRKGRKIVLIVETTRKTGGQSHNLLSALNYLRKNPETKVDFIRCVVYGESKAYYSTESSGIAERITSTYLNRFTTIVFPSTYLYFSLLSLADVCIVGSSTDSISLVGNEYAVANPKGRMIVSYSSGVSYEHALYTFNCPKITARVIEQALEAEGAEEKIESTHSWVSSLQSILRTEIQCSKEQQGKIPVHVCKEVFREKEKIKQAYAAAEKRTLFLDYDGTLTEIVSNPRDAKPTKEINKLLQALKKDGRNSVCIVTGRSKEEAEEWFGHLGVKIYAEHGAHKKEEGKWKEEPCDLSWKADAVKIIEEYVSYTPGSSIEIKNTCVVFHSRGHGHWCANALQRVLGDRARVVTGKNIIEVRPRGIDKGCCIEKEKCHKSFVLCAGDDVTDEDMFMVLLKAPRAYTVCVGERSTCASFRAASPQDLRGLLQYLLE